MASAAARASRCAPSPTPARRRSTAKPSSRSTDREKSMTRLAGKVALISGSGRGIGRALALKLARDGARIVVNDLDEEPAAEVVRTIKEFGGDAVRSEEHTSELQSLMRISYAVFCLKKKTTNESDINNILAKTQHKTSHQQS